MPAFDAFAFAKQRRLDIEQPFTEESADFDEVFVPDAAAK